MRGAEGDRAGLLRVEVAAARRAPCATESSPSRCPGLEPRWGISTARPRRSCGCGRSGCARLASARPASCAVFGNGFLDTLAARFRQSGKRTADASDFCLPEHQGLVHPLVRAVELDESSMVDHPVDHRGGKLVVAQDRSPFAELDVGGEHHASLLVAC